MRKRLRYRSVPARYHGASRQHGRRVLSEQTNKNVPAGELRSAGPWALQSSNCVARNRGGPSLRDYFLGSQLALLQRGFSFAGSEFERPYCDEEPFRGTSVLRGSSRRSKKGSLTSRGCTSQVTRPLSRSVRTGMPQSQR